MIKYILKRIIQVIPVLLGVSIIVFLMLSLSPGDPARLALGMNAKPEQMRPSTMKMVWISLFWFSM